MGNIQDTTSFQDHYAKHNLVVEADTVFLKVGTLEINHKGSGGKYAVGYGTEIFLDGKPMEGVKSLTLRIAVDEAVSMKVEQLVPLEGVV